jgi:hypothetical protein
VGTGTRSGTRGSDSYALEVIAPGGLEALFRRLAEPGGEYDAATLRALVAEYGARSTLRQPCHWHSSTTSSSRVAHARRRRISRELEGLLEDACLLNDTSFLPDLFDVDSVLLAPGKGQVRGRSAIADVIIGQLRDGGSYVAAPQLVMQSGPLALIISGAATSVARRSLDGWHYVISRLDL